ncbi:MAG: sensor histidine kinase [Streptococcaceae bacterium]|jgi:signal transduction histidine kinase|nr:sensor histidine kinase [Streptococcaceae bacterium]
MDVEQHQHNLCGLITQHHQRGLLSDISKAVGRPIVIFQKRLNGCFMESSQKNELIFQSSDDINEYHSIIEREGYIRLEEGGTAYCDHNTLCSKIRFSEEMTEYDIYVNDKQDGITSYSNNESRCYNQYTLGAEYFLGDKEKAIKILNNLREHYTENGSYITYRCPYSGYTTCVFQLAYYDISAVLICDQILVSGEVDSTRNIEINCKLKTVYALNHLTDSEYIDFIELEKIAHNVLNEIVKMKHRFDGIYETRCNHFANQYIKRTIHHVSEVSLFELSVEKQYDELTTRVRACLLDFAFKSNIEISCFMTEHLNVQYGTYLSNEKGERIDFSWIEQYQHKGNWLHNIEGLKGELHCLDDVDSSGYTHFILPSNSQLFNMILLVNVSRNDMLNNVFMDTLKYFFEIIEKAIRRIALGLFYKYQSEAIERYNMDLRHELGQSNAGFLANLAVFEEVIKDYVIGDGIKKVENIIKNARGYAHSTMLRTNTSRYLWGTPIPNMKYFLPYGAFLFKWREVYQERVDKSNISFKMIAPNVTSNESPPMYADPDMIEQVAYNLSTNAIKYGLPGTTVTLDCHLSDDNQEYHLTVSSYGLPLDDTEYHHIFKRGYQGNNVVGSYAVPNKDSHGIGLALSKEIAEIHGGELRLKYGLISKLCVPYFTIYQKMYNHPMRPALDEYYKVPDLRQDIPEEIERLKKSNPKCWEELNALSINENAVSMPDIIAAINKGVVKYCFTLSIPHHGSRR